MIKEGDGPNYEMPNNLMRRKPAYFLRWKTVVFATDRHAVPMLVGTRGHRDEALNQGRSSEPNSRRKGHTSPHKDGAPPTWVSSWSIV